MRALLLSILLTSSAAAAAVTDGDTVTIDHVRIRIANIDAPEIHQAKCDAERRLGLVAKRRMMEILSTGEVKIHVGEPGTNRKIDRYGRTLATITVDGHDVGETMIAEGVARPWTGKRKPWCDAL